MLPFYQCDLNYSKMSISKSEKFWRVKIRKIAVACAMSYLARIVLASVSKICRVKIARVRACAMNLPDSAVAYLYITGGITVVRWTESVATGGGGVEACVQAGGRGGSGAGTGSGAAPRLHVRTHVDGHAPPLPADLYSYAVCVSAPAPKQQVTSLPTALPHSRTIQYGNYNSRVFQAFQSLVYLFIHEGYSRSKDSCISFKIDLFFICLGTSRYITLT